MKKLGAEETAIVQLELSREVFIVNLALAGVGQANIAKIVGVRKERVNGICKLLKNKKDGRNGD